MVSMASVRDHLARDSVEMRVSDSRLDGSDGGLERFENDLVDLLLPAGKDAAGWIGSRDIGTVAA
ncbi:MAG: hypothetical protein DSY81_11280 [Bacillota bacterium]|nr:MAG: hypothetical protein DSY81_11280 [Bacillota bacterium]